MTLDVRADHLAMVQSILGKRIPNLEVWAFGSRVTGGANAVSDLDLVIISDEALSFETLAALRDDFSESNIPYKVDVLDWSMTDPSFQTIIRQQHLVLQKSHEGKTSD